MPPASVLRKTRHSAIVAEAFQQRRADPCRERCRAAWRSRAPVFSTTSAAFRSIISHWLNTTTLCGPAPSSSPQQLAELLQLRRHVASACRAGTCCRTACAGWRCSQNAAAIDLGQILLVQQPGQRVLVLGVGAALLRRPFRRKTVLSVRAGNCDSTSAAGAPQQDRRQLLAQLVEVAIAVELAASSSSTR